MQKIKDKTVARKLTQYEHSANSRGLDFDISFKKMRQLLEQETCYYTGRKFEETGIYAKSIDRIDPNHGYVDANIIACVVDINRKKANLTPEEIIMLSDKLHAYRRRNRIIKAFKKIFGK